MTKDEAVYQLTENRYGFEDEERFEEAYQMAIEALQKESCEDASSSEKPNNCEDVIERITGNNEGKPCWIKEFGECTGIYCDECIRYTYHIRKASYDKGYADCRQDVLDKIRAEIMKLQTYKMFKVEDTVYIEREDVLQIIGKAQDRNGG